MTPRPIERLSAVKTVDWLITATASSAIDIRHFVTGAILFTSEFNTDTITIQGCATVDGTFLPIKSSGGTTQTITGVTNTWVELPSAVMSMPYLKFVTNSATAAAATLTVVLKS
jgi:hypothetical protein